MHKGPDRATFVIEDNSIHTNEGTNPQYREVNEIKQYLDCRYISATEAAWRIFDFELTFRYPSVEKLKFHMLGEQYVVFNNNDNLHSVVENALRRLTMLTAWFKVNREDIQANCYTYVEFPTHYVWDKGGKIWRRRQQRLCIGRLPYAHPNSGERYYLRMLLMIVRGAKCYEDLRTVDGILYPTFRDACLARGLLDDCNEWHDALSEASTSATAAQLRRMFCSILMFSEVAQPERLWEQHWDDLTDDLQRRLQLEQGDPTLILSIEHHKNLGLYELDLILNKNGHSLKYYPPMSLPLIEMTLQTRSRLIREHLDYDTYREAENFTVLLQSLNCDQLQVFKVVMTAYDKGEGGSFFVYGSGGTRKTHLWKTIIACFWSKRLITLSVASSGIAALLLPMGKTAHSMFKIPIDLDDTTLCSISKNSDTAELLRQASLFIWDEAPMTHRHAFEALERTLRDVCDNDSLFGGRLIIFCGDFRQILSVVSKESRQDIVAASLCRLSFWSRCCIMHLKINMRLMDSNLDPDSYEHLRQFSKWILDIGDGNVHGRALLGGIESNWIEIPQEFLIKNDRHGLNNLINFVYPNLVIGYTDGSYLQERCILAPTNNDVDKINAKLLTTLPGDSRTYLSFDTYRESNDYDNIQNIHPPEVLHDLNFSGFPSHRLDLKVGAPIVLLRNIDPSLGLCNGTRLIITRLGNKVIEARILTGRNIGHTVVIPRMDLIPSAKDAPLFLKRRQYNFP